MRRTISTSLLVGFFLAISLGACGGGSDSHAKDKVFTKMRGPNTGPLDGDDVSSGECTPDEKGLAACYGDILIHCSDDGEAHFVDCSKVKNAAVTMHKCIEDDKTADCK